jgi:ABC-type sugar transport system permease subunit
MCLHVRYIFYYSIFNILFVLTVVLFLFLLDMDSLLVPLGQIVEMNLTPSRDLSSIRQLDESERVFIRDTPFFPSVWNDIIYTVHSALPDKHLGEGASARSIAHVLYVVNNRIHRIINRLDTTMKL